MEEDRNYDNSRVPASSYMNGGNGTEEGFSFNMLNLVLGVDETCGLVL